MTTCLERTQPTRQDFIDVIGLDMNRPPLDPVRDIDRVKEFAYESTHVGKKIAFESFGTKIPAYLLQPRLKANDDRLLPAVVVLHTHNSVWTTGKKEMIGEYASNQMNALALDLVKQGFVTLVPDMRGFEELSLPSVMDDEGREGETCFRNIMAQFLVNGECYAKYAIQDVMRAVDVLCADPMIDPQRIGLIGYSFGGHIASKVAAFDERIKATVAIGSVANVRTKLRECRRIDPMELIPRMLTVGDTEQLLRLIAPRALLISSSSNDLYTPGAQEVYQYLKKYWDNHEPNLAFKNHYSDGHKLSDRIKRDAYNWLHTHL